MNETIVVKYSIGAKSHEEELKDYSSLGEWLVNNYKRVNKILNIYVKEN